MPNHSCSFPQLISVLASVALIHDGHSNVVSALSLTTPLATKVGRTVTATASCSRQTSSSVLFLAKKRTNSRDADDMGSWYDPVDEDATPDQVFFQEMERQRLINQVGASNAMPSLDDIGGFSQQPQQQQQTQQQNKPTTPSALRSSAASVPRFATRPPLGGSAMGADAPNGIDPQQPIRRRRVPTMEQIKIAEATLSEYEAFMVSDNWLNEELQQKMWDQSNEFKNGSNGDSNGSVAGEDDAGDFVQEDKFEHDGKGEPWDDFGDEARKDVDYERRNIMEVPFPSKGKYRQTKLFNICAVEPHTLSMTDSYTEQSTYFLIIVSILMGFFASLERLGILL